MITIVPTVRISCLYPPCWIYYYRFQLICDDTFAILLLFRGILLKVRWYRSNLRGNEKIRINVSSDSSFTFVFLFCRILNEYRSGNSSITRSIISSFTRHEFLFSIQGLTIFTERTVNIRERHRIQSIWESLFSLRLFSFNLMILNLVETIVVEK